MSIEFPKTRKDDKLNASLVGLVQKAAVDCQSLEQLELKNWTLTEEQAGTLTRSLSKMHSLSSLSLGYAGLTSKLIENGIGALAKLKDLKDGDALDGVYLPPLLSTPQHHNQFFNLQMLRIRIREENLSDIFNANTIFLLLEDLHLIILSKCEQDSTLGVSMETIGPSCPAVKVLQVHRYADTRVTIVGEDGSWKLRPVPARGPFSERTTFWDSFGVLSTWNGLKIVNVHHAWPIVLCKEELLRFVTSLGSLETLRITPDVEMRSEKVLSQKGITLDVITDVMRAAPNLRSLHLIVNTDLTEAGDNVAIPPQSSKLISIGFGFSPIEKDKHLELEVASYLARILPLQCVLHTPKIQFINPLLMATESEESIGPNTARQWKGVSTLLTALQAVLQWERTRSQ